MELATDTKALAAYSPTSTPLLDALRPVSRASRGKPSAGEYFFLSSAFTLAMISVPALRRLAAVSTAAHFWLGFFVLPALALPAAALVHQLGHLVSARLAGFRLVRLALTGTFLDDSPADHKLHASEVLSVGGLVFEPSKVENLEGRLFAAIFGGPLASLTCTILLESCRYFPQTQLLTSPPAVRWFVHLFSASSLLVGISSLLPDAGRRGNFSDGARLIMLLKNDARATRWTSIIRMKLALGCGEHPREWSSNWVAESTFANDDSRDAVNANWLAYLWAAERQDITSATRYLEAALAAPPAVAGHLRTRLFLEAAVFQAWFRENPDKARYWVEQIPGRRLSAVQRQRLDIALLWAEGKLFDAWEKMDDYLVLLRQLPAAPTRNPAEKSALEWRRQMESRMLTRAWRTMYSVSKQVEGASISGKCAAW